jgi:hypothetical protein
MDCNLQMEPICSGVTDRIWNVVTTVISGQQASCRQVTLGQYFPGFLRIQLRNK